MVVFVKNENEKKIFLLSLTNIVKNPIQRGEKKTQKIQKKQKLTEKSKIQIHEKKIWKTAKNETKLKKSQTQKKI